MAALSNLNIDCDAFLLPSVYEGFGIAYIEAVAHGLPSFGYKTSGVTTAVLDQVTGRLLDVGTPVAQFANVIEQWLHVPLSYQKLAQGAQDYFERAVNWECAIAKLLQQIQSLEILQAPN
jgi:glycosyltransferase involved in cell wall biosynthesis